MSYEVTFFPMAGKGIVARLPNDVEPQSLQGAPAPRAALWLSLTKHWSVRKGLGEFVHELLSSFRSIKDDLERPDALRVRLRKYPIQECRQFHYLHEIGLAPADHPLADMIQLFRKDGPSRFHFPFEELLAKMPDLVDSCKNCFGIPRLPGFSKCLTYVHTNQGRQRTEDVCHMTALPGDPITAFIEAFQIADSVEIRSFVQLLESSPR